MINNNNNNNTNTTTTTTTTKNNNNNSQNMNLKIQSHYKKCISIVKSVKNIQLIHFQRKLS